ncbi:hypothetical protein SAMD00019534_109150 [Acytostelium subglobosum LB1]|uniref:hypothetical protein n=1 Tax=Acytostelium subglobosum LB1 TaxID=1410327 RepID=UPI0006450D12|nr:hypothetical protein SAMD00019534_109150 [Acytostelium subglobosum LB1]GAM27739.1 hypothetical protein SAMD00019534_109150 [Acytostelium subglobosum LB1]|eukprot:XP_012749398.1 hypothetical protein SAMD00019534_109150 [Acytostelium subglobosum LB1]
MSTLGSFKLPLNNEIDLLTEEVEKGYDDSNTVRKFLEKRIQIEEEYAKNLQKLVKTQTGLNKMGGICGAFTVIVENTNQYSMEILKVVQKINDDITVPLRDFLKDLKAEQKTYIADGQNLTKERKEMFETLKNAKAKYDSLSSGAILDGESKIKEAEDDYKYYVAVANRYQASFHSDRMPKGFQRLETIRMQRMKTNLKKFITEYDAIPNRLSMSIKESEDAINAIDTKKDIMAFVNFNRVINSALPEFVFEPSERKKKSWRMSVLKMTGSGKQDQSSSLDQQQTTSLHQQHNAMPTRRSMNPNTMVFGAPISEVMERQRARYPELNVPYVLILFVNQIKSLGGVQTEGIFRIPGNNIDIITIKARIDQGDYSFVESNVHTLSSTLKAWLREIPQPLILDDLYEASVNCESVSDLIDVFDQLPVHNQRILTYIAQFLKELTLPENVAHSKMTIDNMSMVFAPSFLRCNNPELFMANIEKEKNFIRILIEATTQLQDICPLNLSLATHTPTSSNIVNSTSSDSISNMASTGAGPRSPDSSNFKSTHTRTPSSPNSTTSSSSNSSYTYSTPSSPTSPTSPASTQSSTSSMASAASSKSTSPPPSISKISIPYKPTTSHSDHMNLFRPQSIGMHLQSTSSSSTSTPTPTSNMSTMSSSSHYHSQAPILHAPYVISHSKATSMLKDLHMAHNSSINQAHKSSNKSRISSLDIFGPPVTHDLDDDDEQ